MGSSGTTCSCTTLRVLPVHYNYDQHTIEQNARWIMVHRATWVRELVPEAGIIHRPRRRILLPLRSMAARRRRRR